MHELHLTVAACYQWARTVQYFAGTSESHLPAEHGDQRPCRVTIRMVFRTRAVPNALPRAAGIVWLPVNQKWHAELLKPASGDASAGLLHMPMLVLHYRED